MKRILMSLGAIVFVGAVAWGATGAFFTDSQTSTGNTFSAGGISLQVDSTQHYNNAICVLNVTGPGATWQLAPQAVPQPDQYPVIGSPCTGTWLPTTLGPTNKFFNFSDIKPQDMGENTISLHNVDNAAWACMDLSLTNNSASSTVSGFNGNLANNIQVFLWQDNGTTTVGDTNSTAGDNIYRPGSGDVAITATPVTLASLFGGNVNGPATTTIPLADSTTAGGPLGSGGTGNVGFAWCAGTMTVGANGAISCNGSSMGNSSEFNSLSADITLRVSQSRNQPTFACGSAVVAGPQTATVNTNSLFTTNSIPTAVGNGDWFFYNDTNDSIMSLDQFSSTGGKDHMDTTAGVQGAFMTLDAGTQTPDYTSHIGQPRYNIATYKFQGTALSAISALGYRVYDATADSDVPFLNFNVDFTNSGSFQNRLVYVPGASTNAALPVATWTTIDAINSGNAMWTWSGYAANGNKWPDNNTNQYRSWSSIVAAFPSAKILAVGGWLGVRVGEPGPVSASATVDYIKFNNTTYDFTI